MGFGPPEEGADLGGLSVRRSTRPWFTAGSPYEELVS